MKRKTNIANTLEVIDHKAKYDAAVKRLLGDKTVLAWIIRDTIEEFKDYSIETIRDCIQGEPQTARKKVFPGYTPEMVTGNNTEDSVIGEGKVTYDVIFFIFTPCGNQVKIIVNIEVQNNYYPGYDLVTRAVFYCARMISAQLNREFTTANYDDIKKVYSIWICIDPPDYAKNTITEYKMEQKKVFGEFCGKARYDLLRIVMICLDKNENLEYSNNVIGFLEILLSDRMTAEEKYELLEKTYGIVTSVDIKEVLGTMNSLSDYIEKRATERGMKKGLAMGMEKGMEMGMEKGMEKGVIIMARKFLSHSISEETIIADLEEVLGISYEEARGLFKQHSQ